MKPYMMDLNLLISAGINPKTGLPIKYSLGNAEELKTSTKMFLRLIDEQDAVNRYVWYNLPVNITSQELERLLYYKGQVIMFYFKELNKFYFMPYALDGTIDFYGRFNTVHPVPMTSGKEDDKKKEDPLAAVLSEKKLKCVYGVIPPEELTEDILNNSCVILHDYTHQLDNQNIIARQIVNDSILDAMADCVPFMHTALMLGTGVRGVRVNDADQADSVHQANKSMLNAALKGDPLVPIVGTIDFQDLTNKLPSTSEEFMLSMQSLDNLRLSGYGIDNGGLFEKKAHELQSEADINGGPVGLVLQDGLSIRQNFCNIVNSIWGTGIWCEPAQNIIGSDTDGDGLTYDRNEDATQSGVETSEGEQNDDSSI